MGARDEVCGGGDRIAPLGAVKAHHCKNPRKGWHNRGLGFKLLVISVSSSPEPGYRKSGHFDLDLIVGGLKCWHGLYIGFCPQLMMRRAELPLSPNLSAFGSFCLKFLLIPISNYLFSLRF